MWWIINAEGEIVFAVKTEKEAKEIIIKSEWYTDYIYIDYYIYV